MAAHHLTPVGGNAMTIKEGVEFLRDTPFPVTYKQLAGLLREADRQRVGRTDYYQTADIVERHRDYTRKAGPAHQG